ncbi:heterokaryon incompatibility protein-domain-containing protein [Apodospora peruviana]|uniref:Heterokaryon incompatibility protein-domain-containing protein n=1 Tax=Apodospora peruviana TaxID=516989 RepID=A0AAE0HWT6_9PEZI|nr:heterokaryon incompatibility protein-domain-containing protein [Apodospora peruviana]
MGRYLISSVQWCDCTDDQLWYTTRHTQYDEGFIVATAALLTANFQGIPSTRSVGTHIWTKAAEFIQYFPSPTYSSSIRTQSPFVMSYGRFMLPLPDPTTWIRVLHIAPGNSEDEISCLLDREKLDDCFDFQALSYTWSDGKRDARKQTIKCNMVPTEVTNNLYLALKRLRFLPNDSPEARDSPHRDLLLQWSSFRDLDWLVSPFDNISCQFPEIDWDRRYKYRRIWIDQLCINQDDEDERAKQVSIMRKIYSRASHTWVWLGEDVLGRGPEDAIRLGCLTHVLRQTRKQTFRFWQNPTKLGFEELRAKCSGLCVLENLCNERWFERVWVIQEMALAPSASVIVGHYCVDPTALALMAEVRLATGSDFPYREHTFQNYDGLRNCAFILGEMRKRRSTRCYPLVDLLLQTRQFDASLPHDRIYTLIGLCEEALPTQHGEEDDNHDSDLARALRVDYSRECEELYRDITRALNQQHQKPEAAIRSNRTSMCVPELPRPETPYQLPKRAKHTGPLTFLVLSPTDDQDILRVQRFRLGTIETTFEVFGADVLGDGPAQCLGRCLLEGKILARPLEPRVPEENKSRWWPNLWDKEKKPQPSKRAYSYAASRALFSRQFFMTSQGYLGLGEYGSGEGDIIAVLFGGPTLYILRQQEKGGTYILVGECYVHGVMDAEIVDISQFSNGIFADLLPLLEKLRLNEDQRSAPISTVSPKR